MLNYLSATNYVLAFLYGEMETIVQPKRYLCASVG